MTTTPGARAALETELRRILTREGALPPERRLSERLGVNRYQLRVALRALRAAGEAPAGRARARAPAGPPRRPPRCCATPLRPSCGSCG
ncbi:hypothetical protein ACQ5SO_04845 [Rhodovulum sp. DZ06]|uniref:hypothetical protein n=1 Tax=Rhodovulum sp. DZ06 TaxID=3425126 RepID=UPI003D33E99E